MARMVFYLSLALAVLLHGQAWGDTPCRALTYEGARYTVCEADLARHDVRLYWRKPDGLPYNYLTSVPATAGRSGKLAFATNAGMFDTAYAPVGLYVENGKQLAPANTRRGPGNFHLRPNGVFYLTKDRAGVLETRAYLKAKPRAVYATQSGPMLVIDGNLHPLFVRASTSRKMRNGVGVTDGRKSIFAISEEPVSFAAFGRLFKDALKCRNALFLDGGSVPTLHVPAEKRGGNFLPMGPIIAVFSRTN